MISCDVLVIGGGHAGVEAATIAARMGARTILLTHRLDTIGVMSCNPAIGGLGKGHLVKEIDALGGVMPLAADRAAIQARLLNRRKGPAVRGPRVQADRAHYRAAVQAACQAQAGLQLVAGELVDLEVSDGRVVAGLTQDGRRFGCGTMVLTTGTFLGGVIHMGHRQQPAGRVGEPPSLPLAARLRALALPVGRLKTGTPPRLDGRTIRWSALEMQAGDADFEPFALMSDGLPLPQVSCGITRTNAVTHAVIRENLHLSAMYGGQIAGRGPRYCPSIEDKVVRFGDRDGHQVFLEPEGLEDHTVYPNGISTSLPPAVQEAIVRSMAGLEEARILQPGYAIEYDYIDPRALDPTLALRQLKGLFLAGQINGTTGYEEAAAQGVVAGANAALMAGAGQPISFDRAESYLGVLVDDLVTRGVTEPYRMFTSRSEFRLSLRIDNADDRLGGLADRLGVTTAERRERRDARRQRIDAATAQLQNLRVSPSVARTLGLALRQDGVRRSAYELLSYPDITMAQLTILWPELSALSPEVADRVACDARYAVYLDRQEADLEIYRRDQAIALPDDLDIATVPGLSNEIKAKLTQNCPSTLAQASRLEGMTPAALTVLAIAARRQRRAAAAPSVA